MYVLGKRASDLIPEDIKRLVGNQIKETKTLDYKKELKLAQDKDKKEFLNDITSMFNTDGGCLIYGIEEKKDEKGQNTGVPESITGIVVDNQDKLVQQIEDLIKGNSEPAITNIVLNYLKVDELYILVIGINKGIGLPVMVTFNESNKFYRRRNSGKYPVDVYELNQMFMQNQILKESAEKFRYQRIEKIRSLKVFPTLDISYPLFIQIIPFTFQNDQTLDLSNIDSMDLTMKMRPSYCSGWDKMFNIDGFATFGVKYRDVQKIVAYDQLFRNGIYEAYTGELIAPFTTTGGQELKKINGLQFIELVMRKITNAITILKSFEIEAPFIICMSLNRVRGAVLYDSNTWSQPLVIEDIYLPSLFLQSPDTDLRKTLKPSFDILWQAAGYPQCPDFSNITV